MQARSVLVKITYNAHIKVVVEVLLPQSNIGAGNFDVMNFHFIFRLKRKKNISNVTLTLTLSNETSPATMNTLTPLLPSLNPLL